MKTLITATVFSLTMGLAGPVFAFQCPTDIAAIDTALQTAEISDERRAQVVELRDEGEQLHADGQHQASVDTLAQAKEILGIE